jgi:hypothetical protein
MNLSSIVLLSSVLLSGLWGYDSPARSSVAPENLSEHACIFMSEGSAICGQPEAEY